jgi:hypothetical protein
LLGHGWRSDVLWESLPDVYHEGAYFVDKILRGGKAR